MFVWGHGLLLTALVTVEHSRGRLAHHPEDKSFFSVLVSAKKNKKLCGTLVAGSTTPLPARLSGENAEYSDTTCTTSHVRGMAVVLLAVVGVRDKKL